MGQQQSKDELLYQQVNYGNSEGIKALRSQGAGLEWIDREGKTPLISSCMNPELFNVAKTLIDLGANVNAYRPGRHAGTPLHHAAKRGLDQTVKLLLSHGANALVMNDDCQTPLDVARAKGYNNVVRTIEDRLCLFSGWLLELYGPGFLNLLAPQLLSRKVWVVILPCGSRNLRKPLKLELAIYAAAQDAQPRTVVPLWKSNLDEPNFNLPDPAAVISDISRGIRIKLAPLSEAEKEQLKRFCNACKGIPQVIHPTFPFQHPVPATAPNAPAIMEDENLAAAITASIQSATNVRPSSSGSSPVHGYTSGTSHSHKGKCEVEEAGPSSIVAQNPFPASTTPSAPPVSDAPPLDDGPVYYPPIDLSPLNLSSPSEVPLPSEKKEDSGSSSCTICLDAPLEGACIPCGHLAGCMSCLNEIKQKSWGCPVCRAKIDQVVRIYAV